MIENFSLFFRYFCGLLDIEVSENKNRKVVNKKAIYSQFLFDKSS